jgi:uncharacterized protein (DUF111 family)
MRTVTVQGFEIRVKVATLPNGRRRAKAEHDDVARVSRALGRPVADVVALVMSELERQ